MNAEVKLPKNASRVIYLDRENNPKAVFHRSQSGGLSWEHAMDACKDCPACPERQK